MKTCRNCRTIYGDEYAGQCHTCGAPMGGVQADSAPESDLAVRYAKQRRLADREAGFEGIFRTGGHDSVPVDENVVEAARRLLTPKPGAFEDAA